MLGLDTLIICHKSCSMLSILNKLTLHKELRYFVTNHVFLDKKVKTQKPPNRKSKPLPEPGIEPETSRTQSGNVTSAPPSQLRISIVVKLFNDFDAMGRNLKKQSRICGPHILNKFICSVIFLHAWITVFGSFAFTGVCFTA